MIKRISAAAAVIILAILLTQSCVTQKKCSQRFPARNDTIRIEHTRDSIIYKDTVITLEIPGEIRINSVEIPCPEVPGYIPKKVYAETSYAKASAWWDYPSIKLKLEQKDTTLQIRLDNAIKEMYYWKSLYEKLHITPAPVEVIPKIYKQAMSICIFIFAVVFLWLGWKAYGFFKPKIKL
jgi:hypothetical protein